MMQQPQIITGGGRISRTRRLMRACADAAHALHRWRHGWLQIGGLATLSVGFGAVHFWIGLIAFGIGLILLGIAQEIGS